jgi:hypothetical protein
MPWEGGPLNSLFGWKPEEEEDKQLTQNGAILVKFSLVLRFMIFINYTLDWLQTFKFVQFYPSRTPISAPNFSAFFILVFGLGFIQFDPQLTIQLSIFFNFTSDFNQLSSLSSTSFSKWSLAVNFFNLALNWP